MTTDPVQIVEDAIDATLERVTGGAPHVTTARTATAVVEALREAGLLRCADAECDARVEWSAVTPIAQDPVPLLGEDFARHRAKWFQDRGHEAHVVNRVVLVETTPWTRA